METPVRRGPEAQTNIQAEEQSLTMMTERMKARGDRLES